MSNTYLHSGDRGDFTLALPIIRDNPGPLYVANKPWTRPITPWIEEARTLVESQGYVSELAVHSGQRISHDFSTFRRIGHHMGRTICELQYTWTKLKCDPNKPWLKVDPNPVTAGKIVINRTPRYNNGFFPWRSLVETFKDDMVFIGLPEEHKNFCAMYQEVDYLPTKDMLEAAQAIEGSDLYIANQSSCMAICEGLKHRSIQETHLQWADCIYARENALYCFDGSLNFEACGKSFSSPPIPHKAKISTSITPPGGWEYAHPSIKTQKSFAFDAVVIMAKQQFRDKGLPEPEDIKAAIVEQARHKFPESKERADIGRIRELVRKKYAVVGIPAPC